MARRGFVLSLLGCFLVACQGVIGGVGNGPGPSGDSPGTVGFPSESSLLRLTKKQQRQTVSDLFGHFLGEDAGPVLEAIEPVYAVIPDDSAEVQVGELVGSTFSRMSQNVGELHIRGYYDVATTAAQTVVYDDRRRTLLFGTCVDEPLNDHSRCIEDFVESFGLWAMRRPLSADEAAFFVDVVFADDGSDYRATPQALQDLLVAFLVAPNFIYFVQNQGEELGDGLYSLDAYELASRLSYHFWNSMPDEELFAAAADGSLLTESGYQAQVERIYADDRTRLTFQDFFYEWLKLDRSGDPFGGVQSGDPQKMAFIQGYQVSQQLRSNMIAETLDMTEYYRVNGVFDDLFTSNASFARTEDLAAIYEVPVWDGMEPLVTFPTQERRGLLGRAALLAAATVYTHPILRGVRIREDFMCNALGTPPANVNEGVEELTGLVTTRERTESLTSPSNCNACHQLINGLGFPLESFDALGRYRTEEMIIGPDGSMSMLPVDVEAVAFIEGLQDDRIITGPQDLAEELLASGKVQDCFAQHYVRFALGLSADVSYGGDPQTIEVLYDEISRGASLGDVFKSIAYSPAFKQRLRGDES